jgi:hypothetical protein
MKKQKRCLSSVRYAYRREGPFDTIKERFRGWYGFYPDLSLFGARGMRDVLGQVGFRWGRCDGSRRKFILLLWAVVGEAECLRLSEGLPSEVPVTVVLAKETARRRSEGGLRRFLFCRDFQSLGLPFSILTELGVSGDQNIAFEVQGGRVTNIQWRPPLRIVSGGKRTKGSL